ncbi:MAG: hypothetical protein EZS28_016103 [Streblomastix strix]|uniref:Uncharacterized protein n=1 Tax=Streblomastix strix TaxID=222440 RepID=A0A5J4W0G4_9EUKA|nr:MAG: hypothetical protein EZS28_016103 [Streblomastix strix]
MSEFDLNQIEKEARQEFDAEKSQGVGGAGGKLDIDGMEDDYDYYESQAAKLDVHNKEIIFQGELLKN